MQYLASWSANVGQFFISRLKAYDKMMKRNQFHKICNNYLTEKKLQKTS